MILCDSEIKEWASNGGLSPFDPECINPASVDLKLSNLFLNLLGGAETFCQDDLELKPGDAILASTKEIIHMPLDCAGVVYLKSSMARLGLDHALAGWIDPGFSGQLTLELHTHRPIVLHAGYKIIQLVIHQMSQTPDKDYSKTGRYQNQMGPTPCIKVERMLK
jgi:dCTP deaminase